MTEETAAPVEATSAPTETEPSGAKAPLTPEQWAEIEAHFEFDDMKSKDICAKYGITPSAISQHFAKRLRDDGYHVKRGSRKHEIREKVKAKVEEEEKKRVESFEVKRRLRIEETRERGYVLKQAIGSMAQKITVDLAKVATGAAGATPGLTPASMSHDIKALRHLEKLVEENVQGRLRLLNAEEDIDPEKLPELIVRDLTQEEIVKIQQGADEEIEIDLEALTPAASDDDEEVVIEEGSS